MIANAHRNIRSARTKLVNLTNELQNKQYEIQADLVDQPRIDAIQNQLNMANADIAKVTRGIGNLSEQVEKYAAQIDEIRAQDRPAAENDMEEFLNNNQIDQATTNADDVIDAINTRGVALDAELAELKRQRRAERERNEPPERVHRRGAHADADDAHPRVKCQLPEIKLAVFYGDYLHWLGWWQSFNSLVHSKDMENNLKYHYLQQYTKGKAHRAIAGMAITNENYPEAIQILKERFGDEMLVVNALNQALQRLPKPGETVPEVRKFFEQVQNILKQLKQLREPTNTRQIELNISNKLPYWVILEIGKAKIDLQKADKEAADRAIAAGNPEPEPTIFTVDMLMANLTALLGLHESTQNIINASNETTYSRNSDRNKARNVGAAMKGEKSNKTPKCVLCDRNGHYGSDCRTYRTFRERVDKLNDNNLCSKCTKKGHCYKECKNKVNCVTCKSIKHHTVLCPKNMVQKRVSFPHDVTDDEKDESREPKPNPFKAKQKEDKDKERVPYRRPSGNVVSPAVGQLRRKPHPEVKPADQTNDDNEVALAFVEAKVAAPSKPKTFFRTPAFLDVGSSYSFVSQELVDEMKLPLYKQTSL